LDRSARNCCCGKEVSLKQRPDAVKRDEVLSFDPQEQAFYIWLHVYPRIAEVEVSLGTGCTDGTTIDPHPSTDVLCNELRVWERHEGFDDMLVQEISLSI